MVEFYCSYIVRFGLDNFHVASVIDRKNIMFQSKRLNHIVIDIPVKNALHDYSIGRVWFHTE